MEGTYFRTDALHRTCTYRLVDSNNGTDLRHPVTNPDMMDKLLPGRGDVDFTDKAVKLQALKHVNKSSEGDVLQRPFLSASYCLETVVRFKQRSIEYIS